MLGSVTLVTEAYNLAEGQSEASFLSAVGELDAIARRNGNVTVVVADPTPGNIAAPVLARHFPHVKALHLPGESYDGQKNIACQQATSEFVVYLDGDCKPKRDDWLAQMLKPFADPTVPAVTGMTYYDDFSTTGQAMTVLDFGYLFQPEAAGGVMGCYASNNVAFRRTAMLQCPIPEVGLLRCHCYHHAQIFLRAGTPVQSQPLAAALHELPDIKKERHRRGYDLVAALWADPELPETAGLESSEAFVTRLLKQNLELARARLRVAPLDLKITPEIAPQVGAEIERLIALDAAGVRAALQHGEATGLNQKARASHAAKYPQSASRRKRWLLWG